ncbi:MAG TPA: UbiD family decarboxylase [Polyangiaceae bacterium]|jgi:4-hydroxy-3-polyprenylbenzoate decarboxylase
MAHTSLRDCVDDLERAGMLRAIDAELDADLEVAAVHRRVFAAGGPALLFRNARGSRFPLVSNLFGTKERAYYMLRHGLDDARAAISARVAPADLLRRPRPLANLPRALAHAFPRFVRSGASLAVASRVADLPRVRAWPRDGGPFITLPQVYTEHPDAPGFGQSNLGMYRVQLSGNDYELNREVGLHYQIHRGIGVHHAAARARGEPLWVNVFVGGPPAMSLAAVLPLPEGMPEVVFAGVLAGRATRWVRPEDGPPVHADADFVIRGRIEAGVLAREGPFGDHLGYYSEEHMFPVLRVESVSHRDDAIWPFTVVGRPPQEDSVFGEIVHDLFGAAVVSVIPGVREVHAVDEAGVHPLLLAIGSERYAPYAKTARPMELLSQANAILGQGQLSLAKYLFIADGAGAPSLRASDVRAFLAHILERVDPERDLHFQTNTTIDTLDYSGTALHEGSKVVIAACGEKRRTLATRVQSLGLPSGFAEARVALPGVLAISAPAWEPGTAERFCESLPADAIEGFPLVVLVDDAEFTARTLANFLWVTFTRSDPARHVHGFGAFVRDKAWGCKGSIVIDARIKPGQAAVLEEDPAVTQRIESLAVRGGPLAGLF